MAGIREFDTLLPRRLKTFEVMATTSVIKPLSLSNEIKIARTELKNLRQQIGSLRRAYQKELETIRTKIQNFSCPQCSNCDLAPKPEVAIQQLGYKEIGVINSTFPQKRGTPRQPLVCADLGAKLTLNNTIFTNPEHSIEGLSQFSHLWILFHFHKNDSAHIRAKVAPPRLDGLKTGVFASRSPHRPNPIGLSLVKIEKIDKNVIYFNGVDIVDGTPVIDIKPFIPDYDNPLRETSLDETTAGPVVTPNWIKTPIVRKLDVRFAENPELELVLNMH